MVITRQMRIHDRLRRRLLNALGLTLLSLLILFLFTPAFEPEPYAQAEEYPELIYFPDEVPELPPLRPDRPMPRPRPDLIVVDEPGEDMIDLDDENWNQVPTPDGIIGDNDGSKRSPVLQARPVALFKVAPRYPNLAREAELTGRVTLELLVDEKGQVIEARDLASPAHALLVAAAMRAAYQWRFEPARQHLRPVRSLVRLSFDFTIR